MQSLERLFFARDVQAVGMGGSFGNVVPGMYKPCTSSWKVSIYWSEVPGVVRVVHIPNYLSGIWCAPGRA